jgi:hypothetical protein
MAEARGRPRMETRMDPQLAAAAEQDGGETPKSVREALTRWLELRWSRRQMIDELERLTGIRVVPSTISNWVQQMDVDPHTSRRSSAS